MFSAFGSRVRWWFVVLPPAAAEPAPPASGSDPGSGIPGSYTLHLLHTAPHGESMAMGANETNGMVVGMARKGSTSYVPSVWLDGARYDLPLPPGTTQGVLYAVNRAGSAVGIGNGVNERAVVYHRGVMTLLAPLAGARTVAEDIDEAGFVVGASSDAAAGHPHTAVLWTPDGQPVSLGTPASATSFARAINAAHQIVGEVGYATGPQPFLWENGTLRSLAVLPGDPHGSAADINEHGVIAGSSRDLSPPVYKESQAVIWIDGVVQALPMPAGVAWSSSTAINDGGQVVGEASRHPNGPKHSFLWRNGTLAFLEELTAAYPGWSFGAVTDIDEAGRITGWGDLNGAVHAFVLPPP